MEAFIAWIITIHLAKWNRIRHWSSEDASSGCPERVVDVECVYLPASIHREVIRNR